MSNDYFDNDALDRFPRGATARAESVDAKFDAVATGFELLPDPSDIHAGAVNYAVSSGTGGAYVVILPSTISSYTDGQELVFKANHTNPDGIASVNVNGLGVKALRRIGGVAIGAGDIASWSIVSFRYNSTYGVFEMQRMSAGDMAAVNNIDEHMGDVIAANSALTVAGIADDVVAVADIAPIIDENIDEILNVAEALEDGVLIGVVSLNAAQTLTNKTISFSDNNLIGVVSLDEEQTLENKTLTASVVGTTASTSDRSTHLATTAFVGAELTAFLNGEPLEALVNDEIDDALTAFASSSALANAVDGLQSKTLVAGESIAAGQAIAVNDAGTASLITSSYTDGSVGEAVTQQASATIYKQAVDIPGSAVCVSAYTTYLVAGSVSASSESITFGSPLNLTYTIHDMVWDSYSGVLIVLTLDSGVLRIHSVSVTGTTLAVVTTFGTTYSNITAATVTFNAHQNRLAVFLTSQASNSAWIRVYTYAAGVFTAVAYISALTVMATTGASYCGIHSIAGTPYVLIYYARGTAPNYTAALYLLNGSATPTYISMINNSDPVSSGSGTERVVIIKDEVSGKYVAFAKDAPTLSSGYALNYWVIALSGTTLSKTAGSISSSVAYRYQGFAYSSKIGKIVALIRTPSPYYYMAAAVVTITGTTLSLGDTIAIYSTGTTYAAIAYNEDQDIFAIMYQDAVLSNYGRGRTLDIDATTTNIGEWIGFADALAAADAQVPYKTIGDITDKQSGLLPGYTYYLDDSGGLTLTGTAHTAGIALSATELLITGGLA